MSEEQTLTESPEIKIPQYFYHILTYEYEIQAPYHQIQEDLNQYGAQGWEVSNVTEIQLPISNWMDTSMRSYTFRTTIYLKLKVPPQ